MLSPLCNKRSHYWYPSCFGILAMFSAYCAMSPILVEFMRVYHKKVLVFSIFSIWQNNKSVL